MSNHLLSAAERERFVRYLKEEAESAKLISEQFAKTGLPSMVADQMKKQEMLYVLACEIVVKRLQSCFNPSGVFAGSTFMGDGTIGLILDMAGLAELAGVDAATPVPAQDARESTMTDGRTSPENSVKTSLPSSFACIALTGRISSVLSTFLVQPAIKTRLSNPVIESNLKRVFEVGASGAKSERMRDGEFDT